MKSLLIILLAVCIMACSNKGLPSYNKSSHSVLDLPAKTVISATSMDNLAVSDGSKAIVELGGFKTVDNTYDSFGEQVIIPRNAVISGLYVNDGASCSISWKYVYATEEDFEAKRALFSIQNRTDDSLCMPTLGINKNDRVTLQFR